MTVSTDFTEANRSPGPVAPESRGRGAKYVSQLTGLRGLAALIVFISHSANDAMLPRAFGRGFGQVGVMLFFVLSGFLMAYLYADGPLNRDSLRRYALARVGRVFPLYLALVVFSAVVSSFVWPGFYYRFTDPGTTMRALAFVNAPYVFWTIPVEVQFYLVFVGYWFLYRRGFARSALAFVAVTAVPSLLLHRMNGIENISSFAFSFFIGVATALFFDRMRQSDVARSLAAWAGLPLVVLLFVDLPQLRDEFGLVYSSDPFLQTWGDPLIWANVYGVFLCALLGSRSLAFLDLPPFVFLGEISFGFYLMHYPILVHLEALEMAAPVTMFGGLALTCAMAYASLRWFERPVGSWIRRR